MPRPARPRTSVSAGRFCAAAVIVAVPIAWGVAAAGYGVATREPLRDLAVMALWSVAEEIVFRGALQPAIARRIDNEPRLGVTPANVATSLVFAALHLLRHPPLVALFVFPVSLVYGKARELSGHVLPAIMLHLAFNALLYAASWLRAAA